MMLAVEGLETFYGPSQALFGVSFELAAGEVATLMGRNGMGKTTTIHSIMGLIPSAAGRVAFEGRAIRGLPSYRVARHGLGLVPEGRQIFPKLTVRENLISTARRPEAGPAHWTLEAVGALFPILRERANQLGNTLSGGEQQMLAIGRALMTNPRLLILDEATEGLAPLIREEIWRCLEQLKQTGQSILVIDKNLDALARIADRHHIMEKGRVVWSGSTAALRANPDLAHRYLGV